MREVGSMILHSSLEFLLHQVLRKKASKISIYMTDPIVVGTVSSLMQAFSTLYCVEVLERLVAVGIWEFVSVPVIDSEVVLVVGEF
jgi:hypothetical protein